MFPFTILITSLALLAFLAAGIVPGSMFVITCILLVGLFFLSFNRSNSVRFNLPSSFFCFATIMWLLLNLLPTSGILDLFWGERRLSQNDAVFNVINDAIAIDLVARRDINFSFSRNRMGTCN